MAVLIGAAVAIGGSLISGFFSSRSEAKKMKADAQAQREQNQTGIFRDQQQRKYALEDRKYKEEAVAPYAKFYKGAPIGRPVMTDPSSVVLNNPYPTAPAAAPRRR